MIYQLHHQYKDALDKSEFVAQCDIKSFDDMVRWFNEIEKSHPLADGMVWMACNEKSEMFIGAQ